MPPVPARLALPAPPPLPAAGAPPLFAPLVPPAPGVAPKSSPESEQDRGAAMEASNSEPDAKCENRTDIGFILSFPRASACYGAVQTLCKGSQAVFVVSEQLPQSELSKHEHNPSTLSSGIATELTFKAMRPPGTAATPCV